MEKKSRITKIEKLEAKREQNLAEMDAWVLEAQITNMDLDIFNLKMRKLVSIQEKIKEQLKAAWNELTSSFKYGNPRDWSL